MNDAAIGGIAGIAVLLLMIWVYDRFHVPSACKGDCNQGRDCTCKGEE